MTGNDIVEASKQELLDALDADSVVEVEATARRMRDRGEEPADTEWGWDHAAELYFNRFNPHNLRDELENYVERRADVYEPVAVYYEHGSFRSTDTLDADERALVAECVFNREPNRCYYNAQTSASSELRYVEGYYSAPSRPIPMPHAWLEVNGKVVEITPSATPRHDVVYYGVEYDAKTVHRAISNRERTYPLAEQPDAYRPAEIETA